MACRHLYLHFLAACLGLLLTACGSAETPPETSGANYLTAIPDPKTLGETYVSDPDSILAAATVQDLNTTLQALDQSGRAHIDVVLAKSIGGAVPKTAAYELFNRWKIGSKEKDNGLLILLVLDQHRIEFETGYGLEADLPDVICFRIQQRYMVPLARTNRYDEAVQAGVAATIRQLTTHSLTAPSRDRATRHLDSLLATVQQPAELLAEAEQLSQSSETTSLVEPDEVDEFNKYFAILAGIIGLGLYAALWNLTVVVGRWHRWLLGFSLLLPLGLIALAFLDAPLSFGQVLTVSYLLPLLYLHIYLAVVNYRAAYSATYPDRHARHEYLSETHYRLGFSAYAFPVVLAFYWP